MFGVVRMRNRWIQGLVLTALVGGGVFTGSRLSPFRAGPSYSYAAVSGHQKLVALGASVTHGTGLRLAKKRPSPLAFPYILGRAYGMNVTDLGVPGWTSHELLQALTKNPSVDVKVSKANLVTIQIGGDDIFLLFAVIRDIQSSHSKIKSAEIKQAEQIFSTAYETNLSKIVQKVKELTPNAQILLYNQYSPYPATDSFYLTSSEVYSMFNEDVASVATKYNLPVADAYQAFMGHVKRYVRPHNIHPTAEGQRVLAKVGEIALARYSIASSP